MVFELINGTFTKQESIDLITRLIDVKIKFHERKIIAASNEEDIEMREKRIKELQRDLYEIRRFLETKGDSISIRSDVNI